MNKIIHIKSEYWNEQMNILNQLSEMKYYIKNKVFNQPIQALEYVQSIFCKSLNNYVKFVKDNLLYRFDYNLVLAMIDVILTEKGSDLLLNGMKKQIDSIIKYGILDGNFICIFISNSFGIQDREGIHTVFLSNSALNIESHEYLIQMYNCLMFFKDQDKNSELTQINESKKLDFSNISTFLLTLFPNFKKNIQNEFISFISKDEKIEKTNKDSLFEVKETKTQKIMKIEKKIRSLRKSVSLTQTLSTLNDCTIHYYQKDIELPKQDFNKTHQNQFISNNFCETENKKNENLLNFRDTFKKTKNDSMKKEDYPNIDALLKMIFVNIKSVQNTKISLEQTINLINEQNKPLDAGQFEHIDWIFEALNQDKSNSLDIYLFQMTIFHLDNFPNKQEYLDTISYRKIKYYHESVKSKSKQMYQIKEYTYDHYRTFVNDFSLLPNQIFDDVMRQTQRNEREKQWNYTQQLNKLSKLLREAVDPSVRNKADPDNEDGMKYKYFDHPTISKLSKYIQDRQNEIQKFFKFNVASYDKKLKLETLNILATVMFLEQKYQREHHQYSFSKLQGIVEQKYAIVKFNLDSNSVKQLDPMTQKLIMYDRIYEKEMMNVRNNFHQLQLQKTKLVFKNDHEDVEVTEEFGNKIVNSDFKFKYINHYKLDQDAIGLHSQNEQHIINLKYSLQFLKFNKISGDQKSQLFENELNQKITLHQKITQKKNIQFVLSATNKLMILPHTFFDERLNIMKKHNYFKKQFIKKQEITIDVKQDISHITFTQDQKQILVFTINGHQTIQEFISPSQVLFKSSHPTKQRFTSVCTIDNYILVGTNNFAILVLHQERVDQITYFNVDFKMHKVIEMNDIVLQLKPHPDKFVIIVTKQLTYILDLRIQLFVHSVKYQIDSLIIRARSNDEKLVFQELNKQLAILNQEFKMEAIGQQRFLNASILDQNYVVLANFNLKGNVMKCSVDQEDESKSEDDQMGRLKKFSKYTKCAIHWAKRSIRMTQVVNLTMSYNWVINYTSLIAEDDKTMQLSSVDRQQQFTLYQLN